MSVLFDKSVSPLVYAASVGNEKAVRLCLLGGRWNEKHVETAFVYAAMLGHLDTLIVLHDSRYVSPHIIDSAFSHALLQNHLDVCRFLEMRHKHTSVGLDDMEQLVELDRVDALKFCYAKSKESSKLLSERLFQIACLSKSCGVLDWFIQCMEEKGVAQPSALHSLLRVSQVHSFVPRLLKIKGCSVSDAAFAYTRIPDFKYNNTWCARLVLCHRVRQRWNQVRGIFWFIVACKSWIRAYYRVSGKGYCAAKEEFKQLL